MSLQPASSAPNDYSQRSRQSLGSRLGATFSTILEEYNKILAERHTIYQDCNRLGTLCQWQHIGISTFFLSFLQSQSRKWKLQWWNKRFESSRDVRKFADSISSRSDQSSLANWGVSVALSVQSPHSLRKSSQQTYRHSRHRHLQA